MENSSPMEMHCDACRKILPHEYLSSLASGSEVWQCTVCGLREPRSTKRRNSVAPEPIITKEVQSNSNPDITYLLTKDTSGWRCDCPGYRYRGKCTHSKEATDND